MIQAKTYTTIQGDMWDGIAYKTLGKTDYTHLLMLTNQDYLDYHIFPEGIVLTLPDISNVVDIDTLPPWRRYLV